MIVGGALEDAEAVWVLLARAMCMLPSLFFALVWIDGLGRLGAQPAIRDLRFTVSMYDAMYFPCRLYAFDVNNKIESNSHTRSLRL